MADATFVHGSPTMVDYTPGSNVALGDVVVIGEVPFVAHRPITANAKGAVAACGGVYDLIVDADYDPGEKVYWDAGNNKITQAVGGHYHFGYIVPSSNPAADTDPVRVLHDPDGTATDAE